MPLLWISLAFVAGLVLGNYLPWLSTGWLLCGAACLLLWPLLRRLPARGLLSALRWLGRAEPRLFVPPVLLAAALALGAARIAASGPDLASGHIAALNDQGVFQIIAVVDAPPDRRDQSTLLRLRVESAALVDKQGNIGQPHPAHGLVLALIPGRAEWQYGDRLKLQGRPVTPPENEEFSYRAYLARQDVYTYITYPRVDLLARGAGNPLLAAIYRLRDWAYAEIYHLYPAPEAPLLAGILLGIDSDLPDGLARAFQDTGTAHVIAISGFNIAILAELFSKLFGKLFSRWWATLLSILVIAGYTVMVGATPSVVRAAIMGSLALIAHQIGRRSAGASTLALTAALMCLPNPRLPWDASFQLSFGATLGLVLYGDRFQNGFTAFLERRMPAERARKIAGPVGEYVLMTLAAQLLTLPVILYHFQRLSLSSLLANPLILPPQPLVMVLSGVAVMVGAVFDPLAHLLAWLAWPLSAYTNRMVELLAGIPGGVLVLGELNLSAVLLMYAAVLAPVVTRRLPAVQKNVITPGILLVTVSLIAALAWKGAANAPDKRLHLVIFDLDGSQVLLVRGPGGQNVLVNGSPSARLINDALDRWLSPFDRSLDSLVINTAETEALSGLSGALESHAVRQVWWGAAAPKGIAGDRLVEAVQQPAETAFPLDPGDALVIGPARLTTLTTGDQGSVLLLAWDHFRVLIPSGTPPAQIDRASLSALSVLVLAPRDLENTTPAQWLALAPQAVICTPDHSALPPGGINWLNTRSGGWYHVTTDGKQMWVEKSR